MTNKSFSLDFEFEVNNKTKSTAETCGMALFTAEWIFLIKNHALPIWLQVITWTNVDVLTAET